jgi:outer membrane protein assembly factor BamA
MAATPITGRPELQHEAKWWRRSDMRIRYFIFVGVLLLIQAMAVGAVEVTYDKSSQVDNKLRSRLDRFARATNDVDLAIDSARGMFERSGYLDVSVLSPDNGILVLPGPRYYLANLIVANDSVSVSVDRLFTPAELDGAIERLLDTYRDRGYFFARASVSRVTRDHNQVTVELAVNGGPVVTISDNILEGLGRTQPDMVERLLPVKKGDTLTSTLIERAEKSASQIPFLDFEPPIEIRPRAGYTEVDLEYSFREEKQVAFQGGGGYIPQDPAGAVWNLNLDLLNLFGGGRRVGLHSQRREQGRTVFDINYRQPLFILGIGELRLDVGTRDYRASFYEFGVAGRYTVRMGSGFEMGSALGWKRVEPTGNTAAYSRLNLSYLLARSALDDRRNPSRGLSINTEIGYSLRQYSASPMTDQLERSTLNDVRALAGVKLYYPLVSRLVGYVGINYNGLESDEALPPLSELIFIGGPGTLRGYREDQFVAQRAVYGSVEPRIRFNSGFLFAFYDAAYTNLPVRSIDGIVRSEDNYVYGYGGGIALVARNLALKLSAGWNPELTFDQPWLSVELSSDF